MNIFQYIWSWIFGKKPPPPKVWPIYPKPDDWEDGAYYFLYPDVASSGIPALVHYTESGISEGREWKPPEWSSAKYLELNPDVKSSGQSPLEHYWRHGKVEGRRYKDIPVTPPLIPPAVPPTSAWEPPKEKGLHCLIDRAGDEIFSLARVPTGFVFGEYSVSRNPHIRHFNGKISNEIQLSDKESVYMMRDPGDGQILATTEWNASILKRSLSGVWEVKYSRSRHEDLMLGLAQTANGDMYGVWNGFDNNTSGIVKSTDKGNTWIDVRTFSGMMLNGICADGTEVICAGGDGYQATFQILVNGVTGQVIEKYKNEFHYSNWSVVKSNGIINYGTWNCTPQADGCYICTFIGAGDQVMPPLARQDGKQYFGSLGTFVQSMGIYKGIRYAVLTHGWEDQGKTTLLVHSIDGKKWVLLTEIPCAHIMGMSFGDDGIYTMGGCYGKFGRVYFYRL
jgi:hypothetical protein